MKPNLILISAYSRILADSQYPEPDYANPFDEINTTGPGKSNNAV